jgi:hypothetical protein
VEFELCLLYSYVIGFIRCMYNGIVRELCPEKKRWASQRCETSSTGTGETACEQSPS